MKIACSIQARMNSERLPGKVMMEVGGQPLLGHQIDRLKQCKSLSEIIVATTTTAVDDNIEDLCLKKGVSVFRGSEVDVLGRVASAVDDFNVDVHVESFGDSPLVDPQIVDQFVEIYLNAENPNTIVTNTLTRSYPAGLEVNVYSGKALCDLNVKMAISDPLREHVGFNLMQYTSEKNLINISAPKALSFPDLYLEVDEALDFQVISEIIEHFGKALPTATASQIIRYVHDQKGLLLANKNIYRRWKTLRASHV